MPSQLSFADAARVYVRKFGDGGYLDVHPGISPRQAHFLREAVCCGGNAACAIRTSREVYAKMLLSCPSMAPTREAASQGYRDKFDYWKRLAIRDAKVWEVMEEFYQYGWNGAMRWCDDLRQRKAASYEAYDP
jgi:hypothetical protein